MFDLVWIIPTQLFRRLLPIPTRLAGEVMVLVAEGVEEETTRVVEGGTLNGTPITKTATGLNVKI